MEWPPKDSLSKIAGETDPEDIRDLEKGGVGKENFSSINHSNIFLNPFPRIMEIKAKINKWGLLKLKNFCREKETKNRQSIG